MAHDQEVNVLDSDRCQCDCCCIVVGLCEECLQPAVHVSAGYGKPQDLVDVAIDTLLTATSQPDVLQSRTVLSGIAAVRQVYSKQVSTGWFTSQQSQCEVLADHHSRGMHSPTNSGLHWGCSLQSWDMQWYVAHFSISGMMQACMELTLPCALACSAFPECTFMARRHPAICGLDCIRHMHTHTEPPDPELC